MVQNKKTDIKKDKPLRPVLLASQFTFSEYSPYLRRLLLGLAEASIDPILISPPDNDTTPITTLDINTFIFPEIPLPFFESYNKRLLKKNIEPLNPTILHCLCPTMAPLTRRLSAKLNIPYIINVNSLHSVHSRISASQRRLTRVITPNSPIALDFTEHHQRFKDLVDIISMGTFVDDTARCFESPSKIPSLVTLCPPVNTQNFQNFISALKRLAIEDYDFMLFVISNNTAESKIRKFISETGLKSSISFIPKFEPVQRILNAADIFVYPNKSDAFNFTILEAMSADVAIASAENPIHDMLINDQTAYIFDPEDKIDTYNCIKEMLDTKEKTRQLAENARQYIANNHSVSQMIEKTIDVYSESINWFRKINETTPSTPDA